ncbi:cysteine hydrolase family protein [Tsukamurella pseudospumae]|uniref:Isochorismatase n=1 Tax=Tsukamurella pseudospumae TaxID=239498 RepID=A0A138A8N7_9ACTN|nr:cysteine hydrolase family protein [Tsukamurella pseudospumae]KXP06717.1 isochorismatase [Tsukamurella pseudospumae]
MARSTLRELNGFGNDPATLAEATLILVDYQNTYTRGVMELEGWEGALTAAEALLRRARAAGATVIHVVNDGGPGTPYDVREDIGAIHPRVAPVDGERVVVKTAPNAFVGTELGDLVDAAGNEQVVIAGFMTHMCVAYTAEGAFLHGSRPTVVADACATRPLLSPAGAVSARQLHDSALAGIGDLFAVVVPSAAALG